MSTMTKEWWAAYRPKYYAANKDKINARKREWRERNPEKVRAENRKYRPQSQASKEAKLRYAKKNRLQILERQRQYRLENPMTEEKKEYRRQHAKAHYWANREKCLEYHKRRFHIKKVDPEFREKRRQYSKQYAENNKEKLKIQRREYYQKTKEQRQAYGRMLHYKKKFGITIAERDALFAANNGLCHICSRVPSEGIDHDHDTGRIRGALCDPCNLILGYAKDNPEILLLAADYLRRETCVIS
jgi:hypothetical protein